MCVLYGLESLNVGDVSCRILLVWMAEVERSWEEFGGREALEEGGI